MTGADPFSGLAAGDSLTALTLHVDTETLGALSATITLHPFGSNASGFERTLPDVALTITDQVVAQAAVASVLNSRLHEATTTVRTGPSSHVTV